MIFPEDCISTKDMLKQQDKADEFNPLRVSDYIRRSNDRKLIKFRGTCRQRAIRDQVFENR